MQINNSYLRFKFCKLKAETTTHLNYNCEDATSIPCWLLALNLQLFQSTTPIELEERISYPLWTWLDDEEEEED